MFTTFFYRGEKMFEIFFLTVWNIFLNRLKYFTIKFRNSHTTTKSVPVMQLVEKNDKGGRVGGR